MPAVLRFSLISWCTRCAHPTLLLLDRSCNPNSSAADCRLYFCAENLFASDRLWREADIGQNRRSSSAQRSAVLSKRQFADVDRARSCHDCNLEMICLYDVCDVARAVRYNVDTVSASQAVVEQARAT